MTRMFAGCCATVTDVVAVNSPAVAVTVAAPFWTAVTSPSVSTVATESSLEDQAKSGVAYRVPFGVQAFGKQTQRVSERCEGRVQRSYADTRDPLRYGDRGA